MKSKNFKMIFFLIIIFLISVTVSCGKKDDETGGDIKSVI